MRLLKRRRWRLLLAAGLLAAVCMSLLLLTGVEELQYHSRGSSSGSTRQLAGAARSLFSSRSTLPASSSAPSSPDEIGDNVLQISTDAANDSRSVSSSTSGKREITSWDRDLEEPDAADVEELDEDWLAERMRVYDSRRKTLSEACRRHHVRLQSSSTPRSVINDADHHSVSNKVDRDNSTVLGDDLRELLSHSHMSILHPYRTMTCLVNKAASTSILQVFLKLDGHGVPVFSDIQSPHAVAAFLQPKSLSEFELARKHYFTFLFVRHPIRRLVSAYDEKVVLARHPSLQRLRRAILSVADQLFVQKRVQLLARASPSDRAAVQRGLQQEIDDFRQNLSGQFVPTFQQFLDFIFYNDITGETFDSHWTPYWKLCSPCHMEYDVIGKLETGSDDFKYVWRRMGIERLVRVPWINSSGNSSSIPEAVSRHLRSLRPDTLLRLRQEYLPDFHMFGYNWRDMLQQAGLCPATGVCRYD